MCDVQLPEGLTNAARLPQPIYTPAAKAEMGDHDENIDFATAVNLVGREMAEAVRGATLALYAFARDYAAERGIILADTKFEFGVDADGQLVLADEVLTPDSSRYWPADEYCEGKVQPSFDKQYVRNWLTGPKSGWDKSEGTPPPPLPTPSTASSFCKSLSSITSAWCCVDTGGNGGAKDGG